MPEYELKGKNEVNKVLDYGAKGFVLRCIRFWEYVF
jgi:hypothetical protein